MLPSLGAAATTRPGRERWRSPGPVSPSVTRTPCSVPGRPVGRPRWSAAGRAGRAGRQAAVAVGEPGRGRPAPPTVPRAVCSRPHSDPEAPGVLARFQIGGPACRRRCSLSVQQSHAPGAVREGGREGGCSRESRSGRGTLHTFRIITHKTSVGQETPLTGTHTQTGGTEGFHSITCSDGIMIPRSLQVSI